MKLWLKIILIFVPAVAATLFVFWRLSPEQAIIKRAEVLFTSLEKGTLSAGTPREKARQFRELLSPQFTIHAPRPLPSGLIAPAMAATLLEEFQNGVLSSKIAREDQTVSFPDEKEALYEATITAKVAHTPSARQVFRYRCRLQFEKSGRDWLLREIVLTPF
jgi:hypothetical protein